MDYGKVLSRAWEITWRWKVLWILGFLSALGQGGGGGGSGTPYSGDGSQWRAFRGVEITPAIIGIIAGVLCLLFLIMIAIWVISTVARGGLIAGVQQVEEEDGTTFGSAWRAGVSRLWTLLGIAILAALPVILLAIGIIVLVAIFVTAALGGDSSFDTSVGLSVVFGICFGGAFCCGMIILSTVLNQIRIYAERAAMLEGLGWIEAFKRGWEVLKANLGTTIIFWVIFFVIGLAIAAVVFGVVAVALIPFIVAIAAGTDPGLWLLAPVCGGGLIAIIVFALISAIVETCSSATWTLAYREMTGPAQPVAEPVVEQ